MSTIDHRKDMFPKKERWMKLTERILKGKQRIDKDEKHSYVCRTDKEDIKTVLRSP
jgi:hypothetical protein